MVRYLILVLLILTLAGCGSRSWSSGEPGYSKSYDPSRDAFADLDDARGKAKRENKAILLIVGGEWCRWCHVLDDYITDNRTVRESLLKNYVVLKVGINQSGTIPPLLETLPEFRGTPHFYVMSATGRLRKSVSTTVIESNDSYDQEKFVEFLEQYAS